MTDPHEQPAPPPPAERPLDAPPQGPPPRVPAGPSRRPGMRLGPFYFVPQFTRASGSDPWAHRKGEPRPLALLWAVYLMIGALLTIFAVRSLTIPTSAQFTSGSRAMLMLTLVGVCVLWPMVRLSQQFPERPRRAVLIDALALLAPAQAVIWPMPFLTQWGWAVNCALALSMIGWTLCIGALLVFAMRSQSVTSRALWTLGFIILVGTGPALLLAIASTGQPAPVESLSWLSPFTTVYRLTSSLSGVTPSMTPHEWVGALAPLAAALTLWSIHAAAAPPADAASSHRTGDNTPEPGLDPLKVDPFD